LRLAVDREEELQLRFGRETLPIRGGKTSFVIDDGVYDEACTCQEDPIDLNLVPHVRTPVAHEDTSRRLCRKTAPVPTKER
jgi:hypothetical protein